MGKSSDAKTKNSLINKWVLYIISIIRCGGQAVSMNISVSNVAKVRNAQIEIDGITVVAGLNGTGKTTISKGIYSSINAYKSLPEKILQSRRDSIHNTLMQILRRNEKLEQSFKYYDLVSDFFRELSDKNIIVWVADRSLSKKCLSDHRN